MRKILIAILAIVVCAGCFAACNNQTQPVKKEGECEVGQIVEFAPFDNVVSTVVAHGEECAVMISAKEAFVINKGDFVLEATNGEEKAQKQFTACAPSRQLGVANVVLYEGERVVPTVTILPSGEQVDVEMKVVRGESVEVEDKYIKALSGGSAQLFLRQSGGNLGAFADVTVMQHSLGVELEKSSAVVGEKFVLNALCSDGRARQTEFELETGGEVFALSGGEATALKAGKAIVRAEIEGETYRFLIAAYGESDVVVLSAQDVDLMVGEGKESPVVIEKGEKDVALQYEVVSGEEAVAVKEGRIIALAAGEATVRCRDEKGTASVEFNVKVTAPEYTLAADDLTLIEGEEARPVVALYPDKENVVYEYEITYGDDKIEIREGVIVALCAGQAIVKCKAEKEGVMAEFSVMVVHKKMPVPAGYVKISDYLYASTAPGRYTARQKVDFFTPVYGAKIYYNENSERVRGDLSNAKPWAGEKTVSARAGALGDYPLTRQVDAALVWAGANKNYAGTYVNRMQNGGNYSLINKAFVYNLAVYYNGKIVDEKVASYIVLGHNNFDNVPIISLSAPEELWFDGIGDGLGKSVYNNVYMPGTNVANEITIRANMEFFDTDNDGFSVNTQVKMGGGWSRGLPQRTMHLNFNKDENGVKQLPIKYDIFGGRKKRGSDEALDTFTRFRLWNGGSRYDSGFRFNDAFIQLVAQNLNVATAAVRPVIVYLNGEFWGLYYLREHYADVYFQYNYGVEKNDVQYFDFVGNVYNVSDGDKEEATAFIKEMNDFLANPQNNFALDEVYDRFFSKYVDESSLIDHIIMQVWSGNWDGVGNSNNHRLWRVSVPRAGNKYTDGKLRFALHDLDMGMLGNDTLDGIYKNLLSPTSPFSIAHYNIHAKALSNAGFRQRLFDRAAELVKNELSPVVTTQLLTGLANSVRNIISYNVMRWAQDQSAAAWEWELSFAQNWLSRRNDIFISEIRKTLAIDDNKQITPPENAVYYAERIDVNQYNVGNGSIDAGRFMLRNISVDNFELSYTLLPNGFKYGSGQFHAKFIYGTGGADNYVTRIMRGMQSVVFTDDKASAQTREYQCGYAMYEGEHQMRYVKKGSTLSVYVDNKFAYDIQVPNKAVIGIDLYQHNANVIYKNFVIRAL